MCSRTREHFGSAADLEHDSGAEAGGGVARVGAEDADVAGGGRAEAHHESLTAVDLPAPLGPRSATISPRRRVRERPSRADAVGVALGDVVEGGDGGRSCLFEHGWRFLLDRDCWHGVLLVGGYAYSI